MIPYMRTEPEQTAYMRADKMRMEGLLKWGQQRKGTGKKREEERTPWEEGKDSSKGIAQ